VLGEVPYIPAEHNFTLSFQLIRHCVPALAARRLTRWRSIRITTLNTSGDRHGFRRMAQIQKAEILESLRKHSERRHGENRREAGMKLAAYTDQRLNRADGPGSYEPEIV
jgi:hypothetical protein